MMHMTFYWGIKVTVLFDFWKTDSYLSYFLTLLACFFVSIFYQYLENRRIRFRSIAASKPSPSALTDPLVPRFRGDTYRPTAAKSATAILFGINSAIGYMLMLAVMSFNGGVFVAVVLGLTAGYLAFRSEDGDDIVSSENPCACA